MFFFLFGRGDSVLTRVVGVCCCCRVGLTLGNVLSNDRLEVSVPVSPKYAMRFFQFII